MKTFTYLILGNVVFITLACSGCTQSEQTNQAHSGKIVTQQMPKPTALAPVLKDKTISVNGYKRPIDFKNHIIHIHLGDIAGVYNEIDIPAFAEAAFQKYPQYEICKIKFQVVAFNRADEYTHTYRRTSIGVHKVQRVE